MPATVVLSDRDGVEPWLLAIRNRAEFLAVPFGHRIDATLTAVYRLVSLTAGDAARVILRNERTLWTTAGTGLTAEWKGSLDRPHRQFLGGQRSENRVPGVPALGAHQSRDLHDRRLCRLLDAIRVDRHPTLLPYAVRAEPPGISWPEGLQLITEPVELGDLRDEFRPSHADLLAFLAAHLDLAFTNRVKVAPYRPTFERFSVSVVVAPRCGTNGIEDLGSRQLFEIPKERLVARQLDVTGVVATRLVVADPAVELVDPCLVDRLELKMK